MSDEAATKKGFSQGIGSWIGSAEVYDGTGHFLGNAHDQRLVKRDTGANTVSLTLSFVGPFKFSGHYTIADNGDHRLYQGPANYGYAETLASNLIDANCYWPITGLSQRFFLMVVPDDDPVAPARQLSLALMSRGEQLIYVVVGEYQKVDDDWQGANPILQNGTSFDISDDPAGGREQIFLQRAGEWRGTLRCLDGDLAELPAVSYQEVVEPTKAGLRTTVAGNHFDPQTQQFVLKTDGWRAWTPAGNVVGSYSLSGGRALSGNFHHLDTNLRVWRREVASHDGTHKAVVHTWYRGGQRVGVQFGVLGYAA